MYHTLQPIILTYIVEKSIIITNRIGGGIRMKGSILYIGKNPYGTKTYGLIYGEDGNEYHFRRDDLTNCTIYQLEDGDAVEFDCRTAPNQKRDSAISVRKRTSSNISPIVSEVNPGMNPHVQLDHLNDDEKEIAHNIAKTLYVTRGGREIYINSCLYKYMLVKPTNTFTTLFNINREFVVIFSDYVNFEHRSLDAASEAYRYIPSELRLDRGFHVLISNDNDVEQKIKELYKDTNYNSVVIPFSYKELLSKDFTPEIIIDRFKDYLFNADLFATSTPIENDLFFFGRRDYVQDIASKCKSGMHCGIFGLRRSGKTSLLFAAQRILRNEEYNVVFIPCQKDLAMQNWKSALYIIVKNIATVLDANTSILHSEDDYKKNSANIFFEEDLSILLGQLSRPVVLMFDEIEYITFGVAESESPWREGNSYVQFWNVIRGYCTKHSSKLSIVVAGTNPMINEEPTINDGETRNPMQGQLSTSNQGAYLPPFDIESTKMMINTLGGYMGIRFSDSIAAALTNDCGGHPYLIRLLCSYINRYIREQGITREKRPVDISKGIYEKARDEFEKSRDAEGFYLMILQILQSSYDKEYNTLRILATEGDRHVSQMMDSTALLHLIGYGLIEDNEGNYAIRSDTIKRFLQKTYRFERKNMSIEEQKGEIIFRFDQAEQALRKIIRRTLRQRFGTEAARQAVLDAMHTNNATKNYLAQKADNLEYKQLFDPTVNKGCFFTILIDIITANYACFENVFDEDIETVRAHLYTLNYARTLPSHSVPETAENWTESDFSKFRESMKWLDNVLRDND